MAIFEIERTKEKEGYILYTATLIKTDAGDAREKLQEHLNVEVATTLKGRIVYIVAFDQLKNDNHQITYERDSNKYKEIELLFNDTMKSRYRQ